MIEERRPGLEEEPENTSHHPKMVCVQSQNSQSDSVSHSHDVMKVWGGQKIKRKKEKEVKPFI